MNTESYGLDSMVNTRPSRIREKDSQNESLDEQIVRLAGELTALENEVSSIFPSHTEMRDAVLAFYGHPKSREIAYASLAKIKSETGFFNTLHDLGFRLREGNDDNWFSQNQKIRRFIQRVNRGAFNVLLGKKITYAAERFDRSGGYGNNKAEVNGEDRHSTKPSATAGGFSLFRG